MTSAISGIIKVGERFHGKINQILSILRNYDFDEIKKSGLSILKRYYILILSISIILLGFNFIYEAYNYQMDVNSISVYPGKATEGTKFENGTQFIFNPSISKIPIDHININIKYKKPVAREGHFEINKVEMTIFKDYYNDIDGLELKLKGTESFIYSNKQKEIHPTVFLFDKNLLEYYEITEESYYNLSGNLNYLVKISQLYDNKDNSLTFIEPKSNDNFDFSYKLSYDEAGKFITIYGDAELLFPIRCANDIEVLNMQTNKNIILMTGVLIILGSFPFILALKQLLQKTAPEKDTES